MRYPHPPPAAGVHYSQMGPCDRVTDWLVEELIESLLIQTNPKWQLLICDNASTDSTLDIAKSWAEKDNRIKVTHFELQKNSAFESWVQSLEYALTIDGYDHIQIIPGDDFLHTNTYVENAFKMISVKNVSGVIPRFIYVLESTQNWLERISRLFWLW